MFLSFVGKFANTNYVLVLFCSQYTSVDPRQRRASDGVLCVVKETSTETVAPSGHRSPLLSYKTEPGAGNTTYNYTAVVSYIHKSSTCNNLWKCAHHLSLFSDNSFTYLNENVDYEAKENSRMSRNGHNRCVTAVKLNICPNHDNNHDNKW